MSARLSPELRALLLDDLRVREAFTMKAIGDRHKVSRATLARLRAEMLNDGSLKDGVRHFEASHKLHQPNKSSRS